MEAQDNNSQLIAQIVNGVHSSLNKKFFAKNQPLINAQAEIGQVLKLWSDQESYRNYLQECISGQLSI